MPLGQMPVLEVDGVKLPQSLTIARFVAKTFNLAGKDNLDQAKADAVVDTIADLMQKVGPLMFEKDETKKQQSIKTFVQDELPKHMQNLETLQTQFGGSGPYFVNNSMSWADLLWLEVSTNIVKLNPSVLDKYPKLKRVRQEVEKQPKNCCLFTISSRDTILNVKRKKKNKKQNKTMEQKKHLFNIGKLCC